MYQQIYNPIGNAFLSTIVAAIPIFTLLYFIALHPHRDANGVPDECQTVHVPGDYGTIQGAIDSALAATMRIVEVAAGTYAGPIDFKGKPVVVRGAGAGQTVLDGASGQSLSVVRFSRSDGLVIETRPETTRVSGSATATVSSSWSLMGTVEQTWETGLTDVRALTGLTYRIR